MTLPSVSPRWGRFYILDATNRPVQVFDRSEWSRWMAENELIFRRTLLQDSGATVTTRFRGVSEPEPGDTPKIDEQGQRYLRRVRESAQNMPHLIEGLLTLARISRGELRHERIDLSGLAHAAAERLKLS